MPKQKWKDRLCSESGPQRPVAELAALGKRAIPIVQECCSPNSLRSATEAPRSQKRWLKPTDSARERSTISERLPSETQGELWQ
jgi:hypothetical protein